MNRASLRIGYIRLLCCTLHDLKQLFLDRPWTQAVEYYELPTWLLLLQLTNRLAKFGGGDLMEKASMKIAVHILFHEVVVGCVSHAQMNVWEVGNIDVAFVQVWLRDSRRRRSRSLGAPN